MEIQPIINSFQGGLNTDLSVYNIGKDVYTYLENGTFITHSGNELILQNEKGTILKSSIKENYEIIDVKSYGNVAYILSAEVQQYEIQESAEIIYENTFAQHFVKNLIAGNTYNIKIIIETPLAQPILITISTAKQGTIFSNTIDADTEFQISISEDDEILTNKAGLNYKLIIEKLTHKKYPLFFTGRGEIGSFPSPDYQNLESFNCGSNSICDYRTKLIESYHPFMNYEGDDDIPLNTIAPITSGEFNSIFFNFNEHYPVKIVAVQPSYDGTVNIIFTDHYNAPKLINSRFSVQGNNIVEIYDRRGSRDDNVYNKNDWKTRLRHILVSNKLSTVSFIDQPNDGQLPSGTYKYYFTYSTQDDNETDIFCETNFITVFEGNSVGTIKGNLKNINTDKSNILLLENIDGSFNFINVYFSYHTGTSSVDSTFETFKLDRRFEIRGNSLEIKHSGFELTNSIPATDLNLNYSTVATYKTGVELKGRLFIGNIKSKGYNYNALQDYASKIVISAGTLKMQVNGLGESSDLELNHLRRKSFSSAKVFQAWAEGYANPKNTHDYLGYWGGETYMYAIEFIFNDGSSSPLFTIRGIDNFNNNASYTFNSSINIENDFDETNGENIRGIYRFPNRVDRNDNTFSIVTNSLAGTPQEISGLGLPCVNVLHPKFKLPALPDTLLDEGVMGFRLHRSRRRKDVLFQGLLINTVLLPDINNIRTLPGDETDRISKYYNNIGGYTSFRGKYVPAFNFLLEAYHRYEKNDNGNWRIPFTNMRGIEACQISPFNYKLDTTSDPAISQFFLKKFALLTPDLFTNQAKINSLLNQDSYKLYPLQRAAFQYNKSSHLALPWTERGEDLENNSSRTRPTHFSVLKHISRLPLNHNSRIDDPFYEVTLDFVDFFQKGFTENRFTSFIETQGEFNSFWNKEIIDGKSDSTNNFGFYLFFELLFNSYIGVTLTQAVDNVPTSKLITLSTNNDVRRFNDSTLSKPVSFPNNVLNRTTVFNETVTGIDGYFVETNRLGQTEENAGMLVNIYRGSGPRSISSIRDLYFETDVFTPITNKIYFSDQLALENDANRLENGEFNSLDSLKNEDDTISAFGGDCFINMNYRKLFHSALDRLVVDEKEEARTINPGYTVAFVCESDTNTHGRVESIVNITDESISSFYPTKANNSQAIGDQRGRGNLWREYRQQETLEYNTGYNQTIGGKNYIALTNQTPFIPSNFDTRIFFSDEYHVSNIQNGYRRFGLLSFQDYPASLGALTALKTLGNNLVGVFQYGVVIIPVSERIGGVGDSAGSVFFEALNVLADPKYSNYVSELHGSTWRDSVIETDNGIYGIDTNTAKIWRLSNGFELISDFKVQSFLRSIQDRFLGKTPNILTKNIVSYYDKLKKSVIFQFLDIDTTDCGTVAIEKPATCSDIQLIDNDRIIITGGTGSQQEEVPIICRNKAFNNLLVFNELPTNQWQTFYSWKPLRMFNIYDRLFSSSFNNNTNSIYEHYKNEKNTFIYDNQEDFVIEFIATAGTGFHQVFDNMKLICNHIYPYKIDYETDSDKFTQLIRPRNIIAKGSKSYMTEPVNDIFNYNAVYREDHLYIQISHESKDISVLEKEPLFTNRRVRDKYCKIRMYFNTSDKIIIQAILTTISS